MSSRPDDVVSPRSDPVLRLKSTASEAPAGGRVPYEKREELPDYGFMIQSLWNDADQRIAPDPLGMVS